MKKLCQLIESIENFFDAVKDENLEEIDKILKVHPSTKFLYNLDNKSAQLVALERGFIEVFAHLKSVQGSLLNEEETKKINDLIANLSVEDKQLLRDTYKDYHTSSDDSYLLDLSKKSQIGVNNDKSLPYFKYIRQAFDELNEIEWIRPILKIIANAPKCKIIFDFTKDSVEDVDPTQNEETMGIAYYKSESIYIGAKPLLNDETKFETLGTMAHEMTHVVMQLVYENNCSPYDEKNAKQKAFFEDVIQICRTSNVEPYVRIVYAYPERHWAAELIVRVPHLLALYKNNEDKLFNSKQIFAALFKFFRDVTLPDIESKLQAQIDSNRSKVVQLGIVKAVNVNILGVQASVEKVPKKPSPKDKPSTDGVPAHGSNSMKKNPKKK